MALNLSIRGRPVRLSFAWLKPPPMPADGNMTLFEHLRELRYRLVLAASAILVGTIAAYFFNELLFRVLMHPYNVAVEQLKVTNPDLHPVLTLEGVSNPFTLVLKVCLIAGVVVTSPVWLYQVWAFIAPALLVKEKKWSLIVIGAATPLFLFGIGLAYYVLPKGIAVMVGFTPGAGAVTNLQNLSDFLSFLIKVMLVFGIGFEIPVFVLALNFLGVVPAKYLHKARMYVIFGTFVFGAVATPQTDPVSMCLLAVPMAVLYLVAEVIAEINDRRKARASAGDANDALAKDRALAELNAADGAEVTEVTKNGTVVLESTSSDTKPKPKTMAEALGLDKPQN